MSSRETSRMGSKVQMRAPTHYLRVDLEDAAEAEYWMVVFDATRERIERAVACVGRDAIDVSAALRLVSVHQAAADDNHDAGGSLAKRRSPVGARTRTGGAREAGFDHHLVKPAELEALQELLHALEPQTD